jgi:hypothetical protein
MPKMRAHDDHQDERGDEAEGTKDDVQNGQHSDMCVHSCSPVTDAT